MQFIIHDSSTWHNLIQIRDHAASASHEVSKISLLIDCDSGKISIPQALNDLEAKIQKSSMKEGGRQKYAEIRIEKNEHGIRFELKDLDSSIHLEPRGVRVMQETMEILNREVAKFGSLKEGILQCVRMAKVDLNVEITHHLAWKGDIDRTEAEKMLLQAPIGTYLLREGGVDTRTIEGHLQKNCSFPLRCYVLTIVEQDCKISDHMLIHRSKGWAMFNDDVRLDDYTYITLQEVIKQLKGLYPLMNMKRAA